MPLLLTPAQPLLTPAGLPVAQAYVIIDKFSYDRPLRQVSFTLGYYVHEAASLPGSGLTCLQVNLPIAFTFQMDPATAAAVGDPQQIMEAYATHELLPLLGEGATIDTVP